MVAATSALEVGYGLEQAKEENAVLLLDEADSFLQDRQGALRGWEITQVNELLKQMVADDTRRINCGNNGQEYCKTADIYSMTEKAVAVIIDRAKKNRGGR